MGQDGSTQECGGFLEVCVREVVGDKMTGWGDTAERLHGLVLPLHPFCFISDYEMYLHSLSFSSSYLKVPGADLQNVCILQTPEDSRKILELATGRNLVIVGASFIGTRLEWPPSHQ